MKKLLLFIFFCYLGYSAYAGYIFYENYEHKNSSSNSAVKKIISNKFPLSLPHLAVLSYESILDKDLFSQN